MAVAQDINYHRQQNMSAPLPSRPSSALARGVQITEFTESKINPEPIVIEDSDLLMEQYLSPGKLRLLTGVDNLDDVHSLEMKVDTSDTSLGNFGSLLPRLTQLKLSNSSIPCVRDLGSSLRNLRVMWMCRCGLNELDGISTMICLKELYLAYNEISDISPLSMLDKLEILDLEGLTLEGNPICVRPSPDSDQENYDYRQAVKKSIPHLKILDDEPLVEGVVSPKKGNVFDDDWAYLEELQNDIGFGGSVESLAASDDSSRPDSGSIRPSTGYRPGSALRPSTGYRPLTASKRASTATGASEDASSDLTMGKVVCGNPSKALITRRKLNPQQQPKESTERKMFPQFQHTPEHTFDQLPNDDKDRTEIVEELKAWKLEHEKRMEKIKEARAPQVLVVDHDDAFSLSGDESSQDSEDELDDVRPLDYSGDIDRLNKHHKDKFISGGKEEEEDSNSELMQYKKIGFNNEHELRQYYKTRHIGGKHDEAFNADFEAQEPLALSAKSRSSNRRPSPVRHLHNMPLKSEPLAAIRTRSPVPPIRSNDGVSPSPPSSASMAVWNIT
ncbi:hypothetical protein KUTeg_023065 [Tegillarca granosa]|uniref:Leucine-rich repeat-containing protein 56 n=1 Tax=Tegillarca granosa TaxID=220873 RepID=A0ABQ9E6C0_TEGGR|nr:hypothetical protein KUTeg_023065 [Tegillarca granosa]